MKTFSTTQRRAACAVVFVTCVWSLGCGNGLVPVQGQVTFQGKPVSQDAVIFFSGVSNGCFMTSKLNEKGEYRMRMAKGFGLPPGEYEVAILPPPFQMTAEFVEAHREKGPAFAKFPNIPMRYRDPKTSGLKMTLTAETTYNVEMVP